jgi:hypothetical protein
MTDAEKLVDAEAALHEVVLGRQARVLVDQNGERIEYTATNQTNLRKYIAELKAKISGVPIVGGPLRGVF